jgi:hypothetical protein
VVLLVIFLFRFVPFEQFLFILFGNSKRIRVLDVPVDEEAEHDHDEEDLDEEEGVSLALVEVSLS